WAPLVFLLHFEAAFCQLPCLHLSISWMTVGSLLLPLFAAALGISSLLVFSWWCCGFWFICPPAVFFLALCCCSAGSLWLSVCFISFLLAFAALFQFMPSAGFNVILGGSTGFVQLFASQLAPIPSLVFVYASTGFLIGL
ncbi:unnamed protein product, partial [Ilex paraguariensis]